MTSPTMEVDASMTSFVDIQDHGRGAHARGFVAGPEARRLLPGPAGIPSARTAPYGYSPLAS
jgi:hypothetical protein